MNWLYSFIAAFVLIFAVPFVNNYEEVKLIVDDIRSAIVREISVDDLVSKLSSYYSFGSMSENTQSNIPEVVFNADHEGDFLEELRKHKPQDSTTWEEDEKVLIEMNEKYLKSVSAEKMLDLATEVYTGDVYKLVSSTYSLTKGMDKYWTLVSTYPKDQDASSSGTTLRLWVNKIDPETYCLAIAGTDSFDEVLTQYIPMETSSGYSSQQKEISSYMKNIKNHIKESANYSACGEVKKLYVTGHSMGAFFSMWLGTDLCDSDSYSLTKCSDIGPYLKSSSVKAYTFAAPGLLTDIPQQIPKEIRALIGVGDEIPDWSRHKHENDKKGKYDNMLYQYTNTRDLVTDLNSITEYKGLPSWMTKDWVRLNFVHLGNHYSFTSAVITANQKMTALNRFDMFTNPGASFLNLGAVVFELEYHMPYQYLKALRNNKYKLV